MVTMKALKYLGKQELRLEESPVPRVKRGGALVKILAASICGTDLRTLRFGNEKIEPRRIIGHEACGVIEQSEATGFEPGDRVVVAPAIGCGSCPSCLSGHANMCDSLVTIGFEEDGTFAEFLGVPERAFRMGNVIRIDPSVGAEAASLAEPVACCLNGQSYLDIQPGERVVVLGAGFIGCIHAELALRRGASQVIVADLSEQRLEFAARTVGAIESINSAREDVGNRVRMMTGGRGADVVITANPDGRSHRTALEIAAKRARISLFGGVAGEASGFLDSNAIHYRELSVHGSHATTPSLVRSVLEQVASGELDLGKYISGRYPLERIIEAFDAYRDPKVMKLVIIPSSHA